MLNNQIFYSIYFGVVLVIILNIKRRCGIILMNFIKSGNKTDYLYFYERKDI